MLASSSASSPSTALPAPLPRFDAGEGGDPSRSDGEGEGRTASIVAAERPPHPGPLPPVGGRGGFAGGRRWLTPASASRRAPRAASMSAMPISRLANWLYAKRAGGWFLLRFDDTDRERSTAAFAAGIETDLRWLGLAWDELARQSDRLERYDEAAERLKASGRLYACYETPEELSLKRKLQLQRGAPPVYDRAALALSPAEKAQAGSRGPAALLALQAFRRAQRLDRSGARAPGHRRGEPERSRADPRRRQLSLHLHLGGGRYRLRHQPCHPRCRSRDQHGGPDRALPGAGRRAAGLRPSAAADRRDGRRALQAPGKPVAWPICATRGSSRWRSRAISPPSGPGRRSCGPASRPWPPISTSRASAAARRASIRPSSPI